MVAREDSVIPKFPGHTNAAGRGLGKYFEFVYTLARRVFFLDLVNSHLKTLLAMSSPQSVVITFNDRYQTLLAKWTIKNFVNITADTTGSETFSHKSFEVKWRLELDDYVNGKSKYHRVSIYTLAPTQVRVEFDMAFEKSFGEQDKFNNRNVSLIGPHGIYVHESLVDVKDISNYLKPDGSLVFHVRMKYATITCDRDWINSRLHMGEGLSQALDSKYSDIIFKVDNQTIKAHKVIISRCKYFGTMLDEDNIESKTGVVEISDFKFAVVRGLLE